MCRASVRTIHEHHHRRAPRQRLARRCAEAGAHATPSTLLRRAASISTTATATTTTRAVGDVAGGACGAIAKATPSAISAGSMNGICAGHGLDLHAQRVLRVAHVLVAMLAHDLHHSTTSFVAVTWTRDSNHYPADLC